MVVNHIHRRSQRRQSLGERRCVRRISPRAGAIFAPSFNIDTSRQSKGIPEVGRGGGKGHV